MRSAACKISRTPHHFPETRCPQNLLIHLAPRHEQPASKAERKALAELVAAVAAAPDQPRKRAKKKTKACRLADFDPAATPFLDR